MGDKETLYTKLKNSDGSEDESVGCLSCDEAMAAKLEPIRIETPYIFISHTGKDRRMNVKEELVRPTHWFLKHVLHVRVFFDDGEARPGTEKRVAMLKPARECTVALVILSPAFRTREYCVKELNTFMQRWRDGDGICIIPALWRMTDVKGYHPEVNAIIRIDKNPYSDASDYLVQCLWPCLLQELNRAPMEGKELEGHLFRYVEEILRGKGVLDVPASLDKFASAHKEKVSPSMPTRTNTQCQLAVQDGTQVIWYNPILNAAYDVFRTWKFNKVMRAFEELGHLQDQTHSIELDGIPHQLVRLLLRAKGICRWDLIATQVLCATRMARKLNIDVKTAIRLRSGLATYANGSFRIGAGGVGPTIQAAGRSDPEGPFVETIRVCETDPAIGEWTLYRDREIGPLYSLDDSEIPVDKMAQSDFHLSYGTEVTHETALNAITSACDFAVPGMLVNYIVQGFKECAAFADRVEARMNEQWTPISFEGIKAYFNFSESGPGLDLRAERVEDWMPMEEEVCAPSTFASDETHRVVNYVLASQLSVAPIVEALVDCFEDLAKRKMYTLQEVVVSEDVSWPTRWWHARDKTKCIYNCEDGGCAWIWIPWLNMRLYAGASSLSESFRKSLFEDNYEIRAEAYAGSQAYINGASWLGRQPLSAWTNYGILPSYIHGLRSTGVIAEMREKWKRDWPRAYRQFTELLAAGGAHGTTKKTVGIKRWSRECAGVE